MRQTVKTIRIPRFACVAVILTLAFGCQGQSRNHAASGEPLQISDADGGSVVTTLSRNIQVNQGSTLKRRWYVLNDPSSPLELSSAGVNTTYRQSDIGGNYAYVPVGNVTPRGPVSAYEIRYLLFDMWGNHMQTLSATMVVDFSSDRSVAKDGVWRAWENDVSELLTVVAFVAHVRTTDGKLWEYDHSKVLDALEKVRVKLTEKDLSPEKEKPKS